MKKYLISFLLVLLIYSVPENMVSSYTRNQGHTVPSSVSDGIVSTTVRAGPLICRNALFDLRVYIL